MCRVPPVALPALLLLLPLLPACHVRRETSTSDVGAAARAAGVHLPPAVDDFAWLCGAWRGEGLGGVVEEAWSPPLGGAMVGHFRMARDGVPAFYELCTIGPVDDQGTLGMKVKHFHPDLNGWEEKGAWVTFPLRAIDGDTFRFDGMTMVRDGTDRMEITVTLGARDGTSRDEVLRYRRVR